MLGNETGAENIYAHIVKKNKKKKKGGILYSLPDYNNVDLFMCQSFRGNGIHEM